MVCNILQCLHLLLLNFLKNETVCSWNSVFHLSMMWLCVDIKCYPQTNLLCMLTADMEDTSSGCTPGLNKMWHFLAWVRAFLPREAQVWSWVPFPAIIECYYKCVYGSELLIMKLEALFINFIIKYWNQHTK